MHGHTVPPDQTSQNPLGQAVGFTTTFGLLLSPPQQSTMTRVRSVEIVNQQGVSIAAIAGSESDVLRAGRLRWERTIATCAAKPSSDRADSTASRVFTHSDYVQLYT